MKKSPMSTPLFLVLLFISSVISPHEARDNFTQNQIIKVGDTLVSKSGIYVLGFFQGVGGRYLGIWFTFSKDTIIWVANRENPIPDGASASLQLTSDGDLIIVDREDLKNSSDENVLWSSSQSLGGQVGNKWSVIAKLLNTGNLMIISNSNGGGDELILWQSFDYPSDTLVSRMKLGFNKITGHQWNTTSWKRENDPSPGEFTLRMDEGASHEIFISRGKGNNITFRAGLWNGFWLSGNPGMSSFEYINHTYVDDQSMVFYSYETLTKDMYSVLKLFPNNTQMLYAWTSGSVRDSKWSLFWTQDRCDRYSRCGPNGVCNVQNFKLCDCLPGYHPKSNTSWLSRDYSQGCEMKEKLKCDSNAENGFLLMRNLKIPNTMFNSTIHKNISLQLCKIRCSDDCACVAYAPLYLRQAKINPKGCILWFGDLLDSKQLGEDGQDIYLHLPISEIPRPVKKNTSKNIIIAATVIGSFVLSLFGILVFIWTRRGKKKKKKKEKFMQGLRNHYNNEITFFDLSILSKATQNFSSHCKIGEGGFGSVYKGTLANGQEIAVKRLSNISEQGSDEQFINEALLIAKLQHRNLVRLLGCCMDGNERMLIYEFLPNKSLDYIIFGENKHILDWQKRVQIIIGIARGLLYLHQDSILRIIHRDLKASNILLDQALNPKIADFGTARLFGSDQTEDCTRRVIGTYGYMSPEYMMNGIFSMKSDVFSFGVLLLEIISGKRNQMSFKSDLLFNLLDESWLLCKNDKILEILDQTLHSSSSISQVSHFIKIGLLCVQDLATDRPSMSDVVFMLSNENSHVPQAKRPRFFVDQMNTEVNGEILHPNTSISYTCNDINITNQA